MFDTVAVDIYRILALDYLCAGRDSNRHGHKEH